MNFKLEKNANFGVERVGNFLSISNHPHIKGLQPIEMSENSQKLL